MLKNRKQEKSKNCIKSVIICHGLSEYCIVKSIGSNLRLNLGVYAEQKGKSNIQINSLTKHLNNKVFSSPKQLLNKYRIDTYEKSFHPLFKIFIIMDTDDEELNPIDIENFKNKNMFRHHWASQYIVPIYNTKNLEEVLLKAKIIDETFSNKSQYAKIFPINNNASIEDRKQIENICASLEPITNTNMEILLKHLLILSDRH